MGNSLTPKRLQKVFNSESENDELKTNLSQFGIPLLQAAKSSDENGLVPKFLSTGITFLNSNGLTTPNIYFQAGNPKVVESLKQKIENGEIRDLRKLPTSLEKKVTPLEVASLVLLFFKKLPEPILTYGYNEEVLEGKSEEEQKEIVKGHIHTLPDCNFSTLKLLIEHLCLVVENSKINLMTKERLLSCILKDFSAYIPIFEILMENSTEIFKKEQEEKKKKDIVELPNNYVFNEIRKESLRHLFDKSNVLSEGESETDSEEELLKYNSLLHMMKSLDDSSDEESDFEDSKLPLNLPMHEIEEDDEWEEPISNQKIPINNIGAIEKPKKVLNLHLEEDEKDEDDVWS